MKTAKSGVPNSEIEPRVRRRAAAKVSVESHQAEPYDETEGPALVELRITETFSGEIAGRSTVRALQARSADGSVAQVSLQRFYGELGTRSGSFVLQGEGTVADGKVSATWFVVPGSGTEGLLGLRGEGGFEGRFGQGSDATLDYWFE